MNQHTQFWLASGVTFCCLATTGQTQAQIVPDTTLPNNSQVTQQSNTNIITGGTKGGSNLFHSFEQFSIPTESAAYFNNAQDIQNILTRVTGSSISNIDGLIKANGTANLFLLNPNGVIFGPNASLDVNGSFVATTANAIQFGNQGVFSASTADAPAVLTVNPSAFLFNQIAAQPIIINSRGRVIRGDDDRSQPVYAGLQVPTRRSLLLLGGDVRLDKGSLNAPGGHVELGTVAGVGTIGLNTSGNNLGLSFPNSVKRADVSLANGSRVNVRAGNRGSIAIHAQGLDVLSGSGLAAGIVGKELSPPDRQAGDITLNLTGAVKVADSSFIANHVKHWHNEERANNTKNRAEIKGGNVNITAESLSLTNGAAVGASSFGKGGGDTGSVTINARGPVLLDGVGSNGPSRVRSILDAGAVGKGDNVNITAGSLSLINGAEVSTTTFGKGDAGNVTINARDAVSIDGANRGKYSGLVATRVGEGGEGKGGNVTVTAGSLSLINGAAVSASTFGKGDAGNVTINARDAVSIDGVNSRVVSAVNLKSEKGNGGNVNIIAGSLSVTSGAYLKASSEARGDAGNVTIHVPDGSVYFDGKIKELPSSAVSKIEKGAEGKGGNIDIETRSLVVNNGAELSVNNAGKGAAGSLTVNARSVRLDNQGTITATTRSGNGGNITLQAQDLLLLSNTSQISTRAGTDETPGTGGSITIGSPNDPLVALVALENSDIDANAFGGPGGQVRINAQGDFRSPDSDITATSDLGPQFSGTVEINTPDVDPSQGIANLPTEPVDTEIAQTCQAGSERTSSRFISSGRGGLPTNPYEPLDSPDILAEVQLPLQRRLNSVDATSTAASPRTAPDQIVEAQGWVKGPSGEMILTAQAPTAASYRLRFAPVSCRRP